MKSFWILYFFLVASIVKVTAQDRMFGKNFMFSAMTAAARSGGYTDSLLLYLYSDSNSTVTIDNPRIAATSFNVSLSAGQPKRVSLDPSFWYIQGSELASYNIETKRGIRAVATRPVKIYMLNQELNRSAATAIIPLEAIPTHPQYLIQSYTPNVHVTNSSNTFNPSEFVVVAADNNVQVEISIRSKSAAGKSKDTTFVVTFSRGMSYQVQSWANDGNISADNSGMSGGFGDLSGSTIKVINGNGKICVFSGNAAVQIPWNSACGAAATAGNHTWSQLLPVSNSGRNFAVMPFKNQSGGYVYRVMAVEPNVTVYQNKTSFQLKKPGDLLTFYIKSDTPQWLRSDKNIQVSQYMLGTSCNQYGNSMGGTALVHLMPCDFSSITATMCQTFTNSMNAHFANIAVRNAHKSRVRVNGDTVSSSLWKPISGTAVSMLQLTVGAGKASRFFCDSGLYVLGYTVGTQEAAILNQVLSASDSTVVVLHSENASISEIKLYPNPAAGELFVTIPFAAASNWNYQIFNAAGVAMLSGQSQSSQFQISLDSLPAGLYYLSLGNGPQHTAKAFVVSH